MYPHTVLLLLANLQKDLRKALPSEKLKKSFDSIISQTYSLQPPSELIKGLTPERNLAVLKTALKNFDDEHHLNLCNDWVSAMFKFAEQLIKSAKPLKECKMVPDSQTSPERSVPMKQGLATTSTAPAARQKDTDVKKVKLPSPSKREKIYGKLQEMANSGEPLLKGKHITCKDVHCTFCKSLFFNIKLTRCNHRACAPGGWYPHVGERLWIALQKYHGSDKVFKPKAVPLKSGELPSIIDHKVEKQSSEMDTNTLVPSENDETGSHTSSVSRYTPPLQDVSSFRRSSSVRSSRGKPYNKDKSPLHSYRTVSSWNDEIDQDISDFPSSSRA